ncbi:hypothetical protein CSB69_2234 [Morganella morganii]|nr:hypothetical protein CSB69_2234 [Morganella morganii]EMP50391.1 hypothetical protein C790_02271 [Morganella morganii SC01]
MYQNLNTRLPARKNKKTEKQTIINKGPRKMYKLPILTITYSPDEDLK